MMYAYYVVSLLIQLQLECVATDSSDAVKSIIMSCSGFIASQLLFKTC